MPNRREYLTVQDVCKRLGCERRKVYALMRTGTLPACNTSTGKRPTWQIHVDDFEAAFPSYSQK